MYTLVGTTPSITRTGALHYGQKVVVKRTDELRRYGLRTIDPDPATNRVWPGAVGTVYKEQRAVLFVFAGWVPLNERTIPLMRPRVEDAAPR